MSEFKVMKEQLVEDFLTLVQIDSPSKDERGVADWLTARFKELGCEVVEDNAGEKIGGNTGNLKVKYKGNVPDVGALLFSSHMDTVEPARGVKPIVEGDLIRSGGDTILGADDKAGLTVILHLVRMANAQPDIPRPDLEFSIHISEEIGLLGSKGLDASDFKAIAGFVLDDHDIDGITTRSPSAARLTYIVHGKAAHAGVEPEKGINALKVASEAIAKMKLGRIDSETTANIGAIEGGTMSNVVLEKLTMKAEARSHDPAKLAAQIEHMDSCFEDACKAWRKDGSDLPRVEIQRHDDYMAVQLSADDYVVKLPSYAGKKLGLKMELKDSGGGTDGNILHQKGIPTTVLGVGMRDIHSTKEHIYIKDLVQSTELMGTILTSHAKGEVEA
ncbi:M20/M25/M40 family metallo-hydrolase [bacterium]|nr:M20/M25/M40 family metallo-hydrolase [bacterium]